MFLKTWFDLVASLATATSQKFSTFTLIHKHSPSSTMLIATSRHISGWFALTSKSPGSVAAQHAGLSPGRLQGSLRSSSIFLVLQWSGGWVTANAVSFGEADRFQHKTLCKRRQFRDSKITVVAHQWSIGIMKPMAAFLILFALAHTIWGSVRPVNTIALVRTQFLSYLVRLIHIPDLVLVNIFSSLRLLANGTWQLSLGSNAWDNGQENGGYIQWQLKHC